MSRRKPDTACGVIVINKHAGVTSHRIVQIMRRLYDMPRIGHTGTLDPMATGVLPVLLGRAAKACEYITAEDKEYTATLKLGITTDTEDIWGGVLTECADIPSQADVIGAARSFTGEITQVPPMYSAIKVDGRKLVDIAREGGTVERTARSVTVYSLDCECVTDDTYRLNVRCSKGTYIRTLCADIGKMLGCGAVMSSLTRTRCGAFTLDDAYTTDELDAMDFDKRLTLPKPAESLFYDLPAVDVSDFYAKLCRGGTELYQRKLGTSLDGGTLVRIRQRGEFIALGRVCDFADGSAIKPEKIFVL